MYGKEVSNMVYADSSVSTSSVKLARDPYLKLLVELGDTPKETPLL